jgi:ribosomal protein S18 acetylase RimI-like enzyme
MDDLTITPEISPDSTDVAILSKGLSKHSESKNFPYDQQPLAIFIRNQHGEIIGGLSGATAWGWLHISLFWLSEELRGKGYGKKLIGLAETEALERGCKKAHLDTFSFQALGFYQKLGYEIFGELDDYPENAKRFYLKKTLA